MHYFKLLANHIFKIKRHGSTFNQELLAGITTFLTMSYIIFVNPAILSSTGMDQSAVFTATCLVTILGTVMLAMLANFPVAIAPGMGLNVYFAYVVVAKWGFNWENALGMVFISGLLFILLTLTQLRSYIIQSLPRSLHFATSTGIGLFIALIALKNNQLIVAAPNTLVTLGNVTTLPVLLFMFGFLLIVSLDYLQIKGAVLISILTVTIISILSQQTHYHGIVALPPIPKATWFHLKFDELHNVDAIGGIFTFFLVALFDATGTLIGILNRSPFHDNKSYMQRFAKGLFADSCATTVAALVGTSSTSPFIESAAGIQAGGRTGLTALVISVLFMFALFFYPLAQSVPSFAVGPALLYIACSMLRNSIAIEFDQITEAIPAALTILMIPFTFSIADGLGIGIISYTLLHIFTGQFNKINIMLVVLSLLFALLFYFN